MLPAVYLVAAESPVRELGTSGMSLKSSVLALSVTKVYAHRGSVDPWSRSERDSEGQLYNSSVFVNREPGGTVCLQRDFPLPGCVSGHRVSLPEKTAQPGIRVPRMPECRGLSSLPSPRHRGRDYGPCLGIAGHRQTDTLHYTKLPSWHPVLMTVAGELYLCPKFHSDVWNRTEDGLEVPGKLLRMDQVPQLYYSLYFLATSYLCGLF